MQLWSLPSEVKGYELIAELACGGMATVYAARKVAPAGFERLVVIKRLHPHLTADEEARALFRDEARFGATLRHPNVVPVIDVIEAGDEILLVQPYVESVTLAQLLKRASSLGSRVSPAIGLRIVCDVLSGLHEAHEAKDLKGESLHLVHRDVSPQNILVAVDGSSRLTDFGVSQAAGAVDPQEVTLRGKVPYLSPEQISGLSLDRRADLFAAGSLLFEVLTGRRLFGGREPSDTMMRVLSAEIPLPSSADESLPPALEAVVVRALQRDRADRFGSAVEMMDALEAAVAPATHREVSLWLWELMGDVLSERRELLQDSFALQEGDGSASANGARQLRAGFASAAFSNIPFSFGRSRIRRLSAIAAFLILAAVLLAVMGYAGTRGGGEPVSAPRAPAGLARKVLAASDEQVPSDGSPAARAETVDARERVRDKTRIASAGSDVTTGPSRVSKKRKVFRRPQRRRYLSETRLHNPASNASKAPSNASKAPSLSTGEESAADNDGLATGPALHDNPYAP